jgi:hypothetical protein
MSDVQHPIGEAAPAAQAPAVIHLPPPADPVPAAKAARRRSKGGGLPGRRVDDPRTVIVRYRATPGEHEATLQAAGEAGLSLGAYVRQQTIGTAGPRAKRRPSPDRVLLAKVLAELGKSGSNLNQIAYGLNRDELAHLPELHAAIVEHRACVAAIMRALGV